MKEEFLYYIWKYKLFSTSHLTTTSHKKVGVVKTGRQNMNEGPDFLEAQVRIDDKLWIGHVEMHVNSSDWYLHGHEKDPNYDVVILHVVWEKDVAVFDKGNNEIPTIELKHFVDASLLDNYNSLLFSPEKWIPCENQISDVNTFVIDSWKERLFFERLENKANLIEENLKVAKNDFEAIMIRMLARYFGTNLNANAFYELFTSFDFSVLKKVRFQQTQIEALLYGQAGFLNKTYEDAYFNELKKEYDYLVHKFQLEPLASNRFQFFRMRPANFPTIRLAQLAALLHKQQSIFSELMKINNFKDYYTFFKIEIHPYWDTHYNFGVSTKKLKKRITNSFIDILIINAIIPLKFVYLKSRGLPFQENILSVMNNIKSEKNSIVQKFSDLGITSENAYESQALIELKNNYCTKKRCLQCAIGLQLIKS